MRSIHFIGGEKGGVGKSFTARILSQFFIDTGKPLIGFDTDASHSTYSRFYGEFVSPVSVQNETSLDRIIEASEDNPEAAIVVDLAAQTSQHLLKWMQSSGYFDIAQELGIKTYMWHVMDSGADSMFLLDRLLTQYSENDIQLVVVQNHGRGNNYKAFEESSTYKAASQRGAKFLLIANLQDDLVRKIDFGSLSFWAAANLKDKMKIAERHRIKIWLDFIYGQIRRVTGAPAAAATGEHAQSQSHQSTTTQTYPTPETTI